MVLNPVKVESAGTYKLFSRFTPESAPMDSISDHLLGAFCFDHQPGSWPEGLPVMHMPFDRFGSGPAREYWYSNRPVSRTRLHHIDLSYDDQTLFGCLHGCESGTLDQWFRDAYNRIFRVLQETGFSNMIRVWNGLPQINEPGTDGMERYRWFCFGRAQAFFEDGAYTGQLLPAATGIGTRAPGLSIAFLCSRKPRVLHLENDRQTPAYCYPKTYGPKPPSFARATFCGNHEGGTLFVSGTASILGSRTVHLDDPARQLETALDNIENLISESNLIPYGIDSSVNLSDLAQVRVYVRRATDLPLFEAILAKRLPGTEVMFLGGDICRKSLLVEIEGLVQLSCSNRDRHSHHAAG